MSSRRRKPATPPRSDEERLRLFVTNVEEILTRRAVVENTVRAMFHASSSVDVNEGELVVEIDLGDEEDARSMLVDARKFLSPSEDVYFNRIRKILSRRLTNQALKDSSAHNYSAWKQMLAGAMTLHIDGKNYSAEECFQLVVNRQLFHDDVEGAAEWARLEPYAQAWVQSRTNWLMLTMLDPLNAERNLIVQAFDGGHLLFA